MNGFSDFSVNSHAILQALFSIDGTTNTNISLKNIL